MVGNWEFHLSGSLQVWSREFTVRWADQNERVLSSVMPGTLAFSPDHPLASFKPRDWRVKDTPTARRIEQFRRRIEEEGGEEVRAADMVAFMRYKDPTMLQRVSREAENVSDTARENVESMLKCPSAKEFWRVVKLNSKVS
jgi:hypothetical protein